MFKGFARSFAIAGAKGIVLIARSLNQLQDVAEKLGKEFPKTRFLHLQCDVRDETSVKAVFEQIRATFGTADILVNNAGTNDDEKPLRSASMTAVWNTIVSMTKEPRVGLTNIKTSLGNQLEGCSPYGP